VGVHGERIDAFLESSLEQKKSREQTGEQTDGNKIAN
jgi:hypothetical protein